MLKNSYIFLSLFSANSAMRNKLHLPLNYSYDIAKSSWEIDRPHQFKTDRAPIDDQQTCFKNKVTKLSECHIPRKKNNNIAWSQVKCHGNYKFFILISHDTWNAKTSCFFQRGLISNVRGAFSFIRRELFYHFKETQVR